MTILRHLLSADSRNERLTWCDILNKALDNLRAWDTVTPRYIITHLLNFKLIKFEQVETRKCTSFGLIATGFPMSLGFYGVVDQSRSYAFLFCSQKFQITVVWGSKT